ncbi:TMEM165/GDT1 family protein [Marinomonas sp. IMCC 4694]|uniref:TMEM165/GDT1 family protein n=1 Tax=Marinomonas sp. IMCC 4694 TaxID=2605432 RepID=UPI0011E8412B|nr:TMEM165/GDT1 family protein [Marinomonas sp. IMCC 4694]TYL49205.1 TMEM165/GDT1 family protein [Marinomonas sp. IMCC 4694]
MDAFLTSVSTVALAEMGDKTQLLALFLATRFASKMSIVLGILLATLLNHALSAWLGVEIAQWIPKSALSWVVGLSFIAVGLWLLIPDKDDSDDHALLKYGAFGATFVLFFLAEIGDKTQIATVLLGAHYGGVWLVLIGSTLGMMLANVPVVFAGHWIMDKINANRTRQLACALFLIIGAVTIASPLIQ